MLEIVQSKRSRCKALLCRLLLNIILLEVKERVPVLAKSPDQMEKMEIKRQRVTIVKYMILQVEKHVSHSPACQSVVACLLCGPGGTGVKEFRLSLPIWPLDILARIEKSCTH